MRLLGVAQWNVFHVIYYTINIFHYTHCRILPRCHRNFATYSTQFTQLQRKKLMHCFWGKYAEPWCKVFLVNFRCQISNCNCEYFSFFVLHFQTEDGYLASHNMYLLSILICKKRVVFRWYTFTSCDSVNTRKKRIYHIYLNTR